MMKNITEKLESLEKRKIYITEKLESLEKRVSVSAPKGLPESNSRSFNTIHRSSNRFDERYKQNEYEYDQFRGHTNVVRNSVHKKSQNSDRFPPNLENLGGKPKKRRKKNRTNEKPPNTAVSFGYDIVKPSTISRSKRPGVTIF